MKKIVNVMDYADLAKDKLPSHAWDYIDGASEGEITRHDNSSAFSKYRVIPRILRDIPSRNISTSILGQDISIPVLLAPTSPLKLAHEDAELAQVRAATNKGTIAICSMDAHYPLEETAANASNNLWFQLYCYGDRALMEQIVRNAEKANYKALVITVDANYPGRRERMLRSNFVMPREIEMGNLKGLDIHSNLRRVDGSIKRFALTWADLDWLSSITTMPIVLKGVLSADDAVTALSYGVKGIIVSNHGGRQIDQTPAAIDCVRTIVERVNGKAEILVDGGIYRGLDVIKALALGAKGVLIGRAYIWALAAAGQYGIEHVLDMLKAEIDVAMMQLGVSDVSDIDQSLLFPMTNPN